MRYEKGGLSLEVKPLFKGINMTFEPQPTMMKATYYLEQDGPDSLAWSLIDPYGLAVRKIPPFRAIDAVGKSVALIERRTATNLSVKIKDNKDVAWPVAIDPTVYDTILAASSGKLTSTITPWINARNATNANLATAYASDLPVGSGGTYNNRMALTFPTSAMSGATAIDSVRLYLKSNGSVPSSDSSQTYVAFGYFKGASLATTGYNDFIGWASSGAYTFTAATATPFVWYPADGDAYKSQLFTAAAGDTLLAKITTGDSLRLMLMSGGDKAASNYANDYFLTSAGKPYLAVFYGTEGVSGWSKKVNGIVPSKVNGIVPTKVLGIQ
jgi:hypothetical protein